MGLEYALDDSGNFLFLEDTAIRGPREKPKPRHDDRTIEDESLFITDLEETADEAVEKPGFPIRHGKPNGSIATHHLVEIDICARAPQLNLDLEQTTQLLPNRKRFDQQNIGPKNGFDSEQPLRL